MEDVKIKLSEDAMGMIEHCRLYSQESLKLVVKRIFESSETLGEAEQLLKEIYKILAFEHGTKKEFAFFFGELQLVFEKEKGKIKLRGRE